MKISTKGRYGLRILIDLATHDPEKPRLLKDIAQSQLVSEKYLSRLVLDLRRAKLIRSVRGSKGGFYLARSPETITLLEILETMEGPISVVGCATSPGQCNRRTPCPIHRKKSAFFSMHSTEALPQAYQNTRRENTPLRAHLHSHVVLEMICGSISVERLVSVDAKLSCGRGWACGQFPTYVLRRFPDTRKV